MGKHLRTNPTTKAARSERRKVRKVAEGQYKKECAVFERKTHLKRVAELKAGSKELCKQSPESCRVSDEAHVGVHKHVADSIAGSRELRKQSPETCREDEAHVGSLMQSDYPHGPIQKEAAGSNLCLFYSLFNSLPCDRHKNAFAGNNMLRPAELFASICSASSCAGAKGYNATDVLAYLRHLEKKSIIRGFEWQQVWMNNELSGLFLSTKRVCGTSYIAFGKSPKSDKVDQMLRRLHFKGKNNDGSFAARSLAQQLQCIKRYENYCDGAYGSGVPHAVSFRFDDFGAGPVLIMFDTKFSSPKVSIGLEDLLTSIVRITSMYKFALYL